MKWCGSANPCSKNQRWIGVSGTSPETGPAAVSAASAGSAGVAWSAEVKQALLEHLTQVTLVDLCGSSEGATIGSTQVRRETTPWTDRFTPAPGGRGTEIRVQLQYAPPGGIVGRTFAKLFGEEPEQQVSEDLRRFKQLMETGEIAVSDGPSLWRPAQPPRHPEKLKALAGVQS